jgi:hypothetical protein
MRLRRLIPALLTLLSASPAGAEAPPRRITAEEVGADARGRLGPFGFAEGLSVWTDAPLASDIQALRNPGLALTIDGRWLTWRARWEDGRIVDLHDFRLTPPAASGGPVAPTLPEEVPGERGCRAVSAARSAQARALGLWRCRSWPGTVLGVARRAPGGGWTVTDVTRLSWRLDHVSMVVDGHPPVRRVSMVAYDRAQRRFDYVELAWPERAWPEAAPPGRQGAAALSRGAS